MKQDVRIFISLLGAIVFGVIGDSTSSGARTSGHYMGIVLVSIIVMFVLYILLGRIGSSSFFKKFKEEQKFQKGIQNDLAMYDEAKNSFKYFSDEKLLHLYRQSQLDKSENLERLALEEELVSRGLIESSPMHEKLYELKKRMRQ